MIKVNWAFKIVFLKSEYDAIDFFVSSLNSKTTDSSSIVADGPSKILSANESNCKFSGTLEKNKSQ